MLDGVRVGPGEPGSGRTERTFCCLAKPVDPTSFPKELDEPGVIPVCGRGGVPAPILDTCPGPKDAGLEFGGCWPRPLKLDIPGPELAPVPKLEGPCPKEVPAGETGLVGGDCRAVAPPPVSLPKEFGESARLFPAPNVDDENDCCPAPPPKVDADFSLPFAVIELELLDGTVWRAPGPKDEVDCPRPKELDCSEFAVFGCWPAPKPEPNASGPFPRDPRAPRLGD